jgi:hypothetical protein
MPRALLDAAQKLESAGAQVAAVLTDASSGAVTNGTLTTLDFSALVPVDATWVQVEIYATAGSSGSVIAFAHGDGENALNSLYSHVSGANEVDSVVGFIPLNSQRKAKYSMTITGTGHCEFILQDRKSFV